MNIARGLEIKSTFYFHRDFNLEKKIEALPSLSLEEFQEKKKQQRTKKKKIMQKLNVNASLRKHAANKQSNDVSEKALLVGSQKRKARKQSITRNTGATSAAKGNEDQDTKGALEFLLIRRKKKIDFHFI